MKVCQKEISPLAEGVEVEKKWNADDAEELEGLKKDLEVW